VIEQYQSLATGLAAGAIYTGFKAAEVAIRDSRIFGFGSLIGLGLWTFIVLI